MPTWTAKCPHRSSAGGWRPTGYLTRFVLVAFRTSCAAIRSSLGVPSAWTLFCTGWGRRACTRSRRLNPRSSVEIHWSSSTTKSAVTTGNPLLSSPLSRLRSQLQLDHLLLQLFERVYWEGWLDFVKLDRFFNLCCSPKLSTTVARMHKALISVLLSFRQTSIGWLIY
jgi:hypothetical protein